VWTQLPCCLMRWSSRRDWAMFGPGLWLYEHSRRHRITNGCWVGASCRRELGGGWSNRVWASNGALLQQLSMLGRTPIRAG